MVQTGASSMNDLLAERLYYVPGRSAPALTVRIYIPVRLPGQYASCRCELIRDGKAHGKDVSGVDAIDALISCLAMVGTEVAGLNESVFAGELRWEASPCGGVGLGFPTLNDHWPHKE